MRRRRIELGRIPAVLLLPSHVVTVEHRTGGPKHVASRSRKRIQFLRLPRRRSSTASESRQSGRFLRITNSAHNRCRHGPLWPHPHRRKPDPGSMYDRKHAVRRHASFHLLDACFWTMHWRKVRNFASLFPLETRF